jgi:hypothetical protein
MNTVMTEKALSTIQSNTFETLSAAFGLTAILLLLCLLSIKEIMRARTEPERFRVWAETLDIAIAPLMLAFGCIVLARIGYFVIIAPLN